MAATTFADLDSGEVLTALDAAVVARRAAEVAMLHQSVRWADLHGDHEGVTREHGKSDDSGERRTHPEFRCLGGVGTPLVSEFASAELGISLRVHPLAARSWMADGLDLRHRLVPLWELTSTGAPFEVWVLRKIAASTRHLSAEDALLIAADLAGLVASLPPRRLLERLESLVTLADAAADEAERQARKGARFVRFNSSNSRGLKGLYAKLTAADAVVGDAQIQRLAEILLAADRAAGTPIAELDAIEVARSRALGLLISDPESALALIANKTPEDVSADTTARGSGRMTTVLHLHLSEHALQMLATHKLTADKSSIDHGNRPPVVGVGRLEGSGPLNLHEALEILDLSQVTIRPVLDPAATAPADSYAFTGTLREAVFTRTPADTYPHGTCTTHHMDIDHTEAYEGADLEVDLEVDREPGQTRVENAGPMTRHHHRIKTHGPMAVRQPVPDHYVWRTPHGRYRLVSPTGTLDVDPVTGSGFFSDEASDRALSTLLLEYAVGLIPSP